MSTYTFRQQAFALAMITGDSDLTGTASDIEAELAKRIDERFLSNAGLIKLIGNWKRVWGPSVWQDTEGQSNVADNAMYVAYNGSSEEPVYVVAVAGTNFKSKVDWYVEDFAVQDLVPWPGHDTAKISTGTSVGLTNLLEMTSNGQTLSAYLTSVSGRATANVMFAGHSLGGALSPVLALSLFDQMVGSGWDKDNFHVTPTAGPTPGNQAFVDLFQQAFPQETPAGPNVVVWNSLDLVPHAWAPATFTADKLENVYQPNLAATACIKAVIEKMLTILAATDPYVQLPNLEFTGVYKPPPGGELSFPDNTCSFIAQVLYQHIYAYYVNVAPELLTLQDHSWNPLFAPFNPFDDDAGTGQMIYLYGKYVKPKLASAYPGSCPQN